MNDFTLLRFSKIYFVAYYMIYLGDCSVCS